MLHDIAAGVDKWLVTGTGSSPVPKRSKRSERGGEHSPAPEAAFSESQSEWLRTAMRGALTHFGSVVEERFVALEGKVDALADLRQRNECLEKHVLEIKQDTAKSLEELRQRLDQQATVPPTMPESANTALDPAASSTRLAPAGAICTPYELRTVARIGNLGWNTEPGVIRDRAAAILTDAGVPADSWSGLCSTSAKPGSSAELVFRDPSALQAARLKVKSLQRMIEGDRVVWLDAKRDRSEMRPARLTHRAFEALQDLGAERIGDKPFVKNIKGKFITLSGRRIGFSLRGDWKWTPEAVEFFGRDILDIVTSYAEDS